MQSREVPAVQEHSPAIIPITQELAASMATLPLPTTPAVDEGGGAAASGTAADSDDARSEGEPSGWELLTRSQCISPHGSPRMERSSYDQEPATSLSVDEVSRRLALAEPACQPSAPSPQRSLPAAMEAPAAAPAVAAEAEPSLAGDSPRSTGSVGMLDERHEVYSMSQDGSVNDLSDTEADVLMTQAEPGPPLACSPSSACALGTSAAATTEGPGSAAKDGAESVSPVPVAAASALAVAAAEALRSLGSFGSSLGAELEALAEGVRAYMATAKPSAAEAAALVWHRVAAWVGSVRARMAGLAAQGREMASIASSFASGQLAGLRTALPACISELREGALGGTDAVALRMAALQPAGAGAVRAAAVAAAAAAQELGCRAATALAAARKRMGTGKWDWAHVALAAAALGALALLAGSCKANARLAARLAEREEQLAELLTRIVKLQASMRNRTVPIIRHASACSSAASCLAAASGAACISSSSHVVGGYPLVALAAV